jgi:hypothetical protein
LGRETVEAEEEKRKKQEFSHNDFWIKLPNGSNILRENKKIRRQNYDVTKAFDIC